MNFSKAVLFIYTVYFKAKKQKNKKIVGKREKEKRKLGRKNEYEKNIVCQKNKSSFINFYERKFAKFRNHKVTIV